MIKALLRRWYVIVGAGAVGVLLAALSLGSGPLFESAISIAPSQGASTAESGSSSISSLAAIAGIGGGGSQTLSPYDQLLATLKSAELAEAVFQDKLLLHKIFSARWDESIHQWKTNTSTLSAIAHSIDETFGVYRPRDVGVDDVVAYLRSNVKITNDKTSAIRVISVRTANPQNSYDILNSIYHKADDIVRRSDAQFVSQQVDYLQRRLDTITNVDHRQQLAIILSDYEKRLMLAQGRSNYASRVVDYPQVARSPATLRPTIVLLLGAIIGVIVGVSIVAFLKIRRRSLEQLAILKDDSLALE